MELSAQKSAEKTAAQLVEKQKRFLLAESSVLNVRSKHSLKEKRRLKEEERKLFAAPSVDHAEREAASVLLIDDKEDDSLVDMYHRSDDLNMSESPWEYEEEEAFVGEVALKNYYEKVRNISRIKEKETYRGKEKATPLVEFLHKVSKEKMLPKGLGFVHRKGKPNEMNLKSFYMGDDYAEALSLGLEISKFTNTLNVSRNNLSKRGVYAILNKAPITLEQLDLSNNEHLGLASY